MVLQPSGRTIPVAEGGIGLLPLSCVHDAASVTGELRETDRGRPVHIRPQARPRVDGRTCSHEDSVPNGWKDPW